MYRPTIPLQGREWVHAAIDKGSMPERRKSAVTHQHHGFTQFTSARRGKSAIRENTDTVLWKLRHDT